MRAQRPFLRAVRRFRRRVALDTLGVALVAVFLISPRPADGAGHRPGLRSILEGLSFVRGRQSIQGAHLIDINAMVFGMPRALLPALTTCGRRSTIKAWWHQPKAWWHQPKVSRWPRPTTLKELARSRHAAARGGPRARRTCKSPGPADEDPGYLTLCHHTVTKSGGGGNRTRVLQYLTRASPGAACSAFLSPDDHASKTSTGSAAVRCPA
jgi:hypothetical protein